MQVAHPTPQDSQRDGLDLVSGAAAAAHLELAGRGEPGAVEFDLLDHLVDPLSLHRDGLDDRGPPSFDGAAVAVAVPEGEHVAKVADDDVRALAVGLVDDKDVGHLQDPGLGRLDAVAHAGCQQHERRVGDRGDLDLRLADPDGLYEDDVTPSGSEDA